MTRSAFHYKYLNISLKGISITLVHSTFGLNINKSIFDILIKKHRKSKDINVVAWTHVDKNDLQCNIKHLQALDAHSTIILQKLFTVDDLNYYITVGNWNYDQLLLEN